MDGVDGAEFGEGPVVLAVPVLFAGPEELATCFLFRTLGPPLEAPFSPDIHIFFRQGFRGCWNVLCTNLKSA